jgi:hypothetical protein
MLLHRLVKRLPIESDVAKAIIGGVVGGSIVAIVVIVISNLLGFPAPPGVAAALGAVCGCSYIATHR